METWGSGGIAPPFLISALDGGEWSASRPGRFNAGKIRQFIIYEYASHPTFKFMAPWKPQILQLLKILLAFYGTGSSLPCIQELVTCPYPEPLESRPPDPVQFL
jgi:hypothetical protein